MVRFASLKGLGDDSTILSFFGGGTPAGTDPGFDVCDVSGGNCTNAGSVLSQAQLNQLSNANAAYNPPETIVATTPTTTGISVQTIMWAVVIGLGVYVISSTGRR